MPSPQPPSTLRRLEPWLVAGLCALAAVGLGVLQWRRPGFGPDFVVFWKAAQHLFGQVYVFKAAPGEFPPFAYPPTLLLLLAPFSHMGIEAAYLIWTAASVFAFTAAGSTLSGRLTPIAFIAPSAVFALVTGQTTLLVGAGLIAGVARLSRPWIAGVLLGLALCIKPQVGFLLPIGLVVGGHWRALAAVALTAIVLAAAASLVFGPAIWWDWLRALPALEDYGRIKHLQTVSFAALAGPLLRIALMAAGALITALAFRRDDPAVRVIAGVGASLLCAPHAMGYDTAILAPALLAMIARRTWARLPAAGYWLAMVNSPVPLAALVLLCGTPLLKPLDRRWPFPALWRPGAAREPRP
jgi:hypothetical protein